MTELFLLVMGPKERVEEFNQIFTSVINKVRPKESPSQEIHIEVFKNALITPISMFVKRVGNNTLVLNFQEAKKVEFEMMDCKEIKTTFTKREVIEPKLMLSYPGHNLNKLQRIRINMPWIWKVCN
jgi:hypothetical protein